MDSMLLSPSINGGNIAREGFNYQDSFILLNLGNWLASTGFCEFFNENLGDIEVGYFTIMGYRRVCYETKNYTLSPSDVWSELEQFREICDKSEGLYTFFILVMPDMPQTLQPLKSKIDIFRSKGCNFAQNSSIYTEAREDIIYWIKQKNQSELLAEFIADHVCFEKFNMLNAEREFAGHVTKSLPSLIDVTSRKIEMLRLSWKNLIERSVKGPITRKLVEQELLTALGNDQDFWLNHPTEVHLVTDPSTVIPQLFNLSINLIPYTGQGRHERSDVDWQTLINELDNFGSFLRSSRPRRKILLNAELRMSSAVAAGYAFRAVKGHELYMLHRGNTYVISESIRSLSNLFEHDNCEVIGTVDDGVIGIQIGVALKQNLEQACIQFGFTSSPKLLLLTESPVMDNDHLNILVHEAKHALSKFKSQYNPSRMHLFIKAPAFFAMALGHRLNGLGIVHLYDWTGSCYNPTVIIDTCK